MSQEIEEDADYMRTVWKRTRQVVLLALLSLMFIEVPVMMNGNPVQTVSQNNSMTSLRTAPKQGNGFAVAEDQVYTEDFASTTYMNATSTNATGWGTGDLALPHVSPTITGSIATPGNAIGVYISGDYAYVTDNASGLQVVNIANPTHPSLAGSCATPSNALDVYVSGDYAYVADNASGLQVVNIANPTHPSLVGSGVNLGNAVGVYVSGDYAYVADADSGLQVVNITDSTHPSLAGSCALGGSAQSVFVSGSYAYVADDTSGLEVVNITDPTNPSQTGSCITPSAALDVYVSGEYAYVADNTSGLQVVNIANPTHPSLVGSSVNLGNAVGVYVSGDYAYVTDYDAGLRVVDITDPVHPSLASSCVTPGNAMNVYVSGDCAYVADYGSGLQVVKIANAIPPSLAGSYNEPGNPQGVYVSGDYAYLADSSSDNLKVVNVADPTLPSLVGSYTMPGPGYGVCVSGDYAYVAAYGAGLVVVNITNPTHPSFVGSYAPPTVVALGVYVSGDYAYVALQQDGLAVVNITNPTHPSLAGHYLTSSEAYSVYVSGDYAYVADSDLGLEVVNITDPTHPNYAGWYATSGYAFAVYVSGDYAYVAEGGSEMEVVNITDPAHPSLAGSNGYPAESYGVYVSGDYAYFADYNAGLVVLNITDPTHPLLFGSVPCGAYSVYVSGDYAYVADWNTGLKVVEVQQNICRGYVIPAMAQSLPVNQGYSSAEGYVLTRATLQVAEIQPLYTSETYYLSADNGSHWEPVTSGVQHSFVNGGDGLCWRAVLSTTAWDQTPIVSELSIDYTVRLKAPGSPSPSNGQMVGTHTPLLQWNDDYTGLGYLVQVDSVTSFDSVNLVNITVPGGWKNCTAAALPDGLWYWRVAANDTDGVLGVFSGPWSMTIDTTGPTWDQMPTNRAVEFLTSFRYDLNASAATGISKWWINDTARFTIDSSGVITNTTPLAVGVYGIKVSVNDTYNNVLSAKFSVTVQDTIAPTWDQTFTNRVVEFLTPFRYDLNASDPAGISKWWINDTSRFTVDGSGVITNTTPLAVGVYGIQVRVNDTLNNIQTAEFSVTVQDTIAPYWEEMPANITLDYGQALSYHLQAADSSGISSYEINDTVHFLIDAAGHITNATTLEPGTYDVLVTVYDPYGNYITGDFTVTVLGQQTTTTTTTTTTTATTSTSGTPPTSTPTTSTIAPPDFGTLALILSGIGWVVVLAVVVVYTKRRPSA